MDTLLLMITILSLAMATGLAIVAARLVRDERRRSDARTALLIELAAEPGEPLVWQMPAVAARPAAPLAASPTAPAGPPAREAPAVCLDDLELGRSGFSVVGVPNLFAPPTPVSPAGRRFVVAAALAAVVFATWLAVISTRPRAATPVLTQAKAAPAAAPAPLELLSLRHTQQDSGLTITGLVQNPRGGAYVSRVDATVAVFGSDGAALASGRAPLDFTTLAPGDESPFVVTIPISGPVARYRVGFRTEDDAVISHVDRRGPDALARK